MHISTAHIWGKVIFSETCVILFTVGEDLCMMSLPIWLPRGSLSRGVSGGGVSFWEFLLGRPPRRLSLTYNTLVQYYMYFKSNVLFVQVDLFRCLQISFLIDLHCKTSIRNLLNPRKCPHFL